MKLKSKLFVICLAAAAVFTAVGVSEQAEASDFHVTERGMT
ncbi:PhrC/PhrF family phosphatase-inhibitory pheromone [Bacillus halotolerans]|nr:PhrC/PhrF family phosphatase-inhibitory pheromone [Bacillus halotolerans]MBU5247574.1 PhrC/PhrF family phosphatase-inhibitory pheromone [Bacillus halotolerans]